VQNTGMMYQFTLIIVATALVVVPQWFSTYKAQRHSQRLAELSEGASETYFEERRALETYRPRRSLWPYRLFGLALMAFVISSLVFRR
jgi:hypothetical protein